MDNATIPLLPTYKQQLRQQELRHERRFDDIVAQLQQERAAARTLRASLQAARAQSSALRAETKAAYDRITLECARLRIVLNVKQQVINLLLPFYPHPISPELRQQLELS